MSSNNERFFKLVAEGIETEIDSCNLSEEEMKVVMDGYMKCFKEQWDQVVDFFGKDPLVPSAPIIDADYFDVNESQVLEEELQEPMMQDHAMKEAINNFQMDIMIEEQENAINLVTRKQRKFPYVIKEAHAHIIRLKTDLAFEPPELPSTEESLLLAIKSLPRQYPYSLGRISSEIDANTSAICSETTNFKTISEALSTMEKNQLIEAAENESTTNTI